MVYLAPAPTFYRIITKKSTEGFHSIPYVVALFSSMIWIYYATLKTDATLLVTINAFGCVIETLYITIYIAYAPKNIKIQTTKLVVSLNIVGFWVIALSTHYLAEGPTRATILGWICLIISISVFAAPLSIMKRVIRTKSVEFMPFGLSFFLALSAVMWFFYGLLQKDIYVALPNIIGFVLGDVQMVLYFIFKNYNKKKLALEQKLPITISTLDTNPIPNTPKHETNKDINTYNQTTESKCTQEENVEARLAEESMAIGTIPVNDVMKEDMIIKPNAIEDHNQMKTMAVTNQVYLVETAA
ncbi:hypothetical protein R6Q59_031486 [Mikania micrantha]|uniref:Bidirectional sugar transporter SWEET n=1 Tax=Mikania micrantha TaxID=192012 RepID=A0A5N6NVC8_9ASTR|nr:hypothetical protein E3N88_15430 [Mikania micrantha]